MYSLKFMQKMFTDVKAYIHWIAYYIKIFMPKSHGGLRK